MTQENAAGEQPLRLLTLASEIIASYVSKNSVRHGDLPNLITVVHTTLAELSNGAAEPQVEEPQVPAISVRKSIMPDYIVCLENGKKFKSLKRHLATSYGMTPDQYRAKWNLPADYPMTAPAYAAARSALAKKIGLGASRSGSELPKPTIVSEAPVRGRGRPKKGTVARHVEEVGVQL